MKKILLLVGIVSLFGTAIGQGAMKVNPVEFTSNPLKFNGKMITVSSVQVNMESKQVGPNPIGSPSGSVIAGPGVTPGPIGVGNQITRCNAPRSFRVLDVEFIDDPTFERCFFISESMYSSLPKGQPSLNMELTFKGDSKLGYTVTMYKLK